VNELPLELEPEPELDPEPEPMPGQWWPLRGPPAGGLAPRTGGFAGRFDPVDPEDVVGAVGVVDDVVEEDEAAFAIAAPPPANAAVTATVVITDLIRICDSPPLCVFGRRGG
jgi:hypothetical protein